MKKDIILENHLKYQNLKDTFTRDKMCEPYWYEFKIDKQQSMNSKEFH